MVEAGEEDDDEVVSSASFSAWWLCLMAVSINNSSHWHSQAGQVAVELMPGSLTTAAFFFVSSPALVSASYSGGKQEKREIGA